jgi:DNA-binding NtrC family response regulator
MQELTDTAVKQKILIIDDDVEWTDLLKIFFGMKYDVGVANHADNAIEAIRMQAPRVIILDLVMPSVDGFGLMRRLNEMSLLTAPTVLITGWGSPDVRECAASIGCTAVLSKPVSLEELDKVISALIEGEGTKRIAEPPGV